MTPRFYALLALSAVLVTINSGANTTYTLHGAKCSDPNPPETPACSTICMAIRRADGNCVVAKYTESTPLLRRYCIKDDNSEEAWKSECTQVAVQGSTLEQCGKMTRWNCGTTSSNEHCTIPATCVCDMSGGIPSMSNTTSMTLMCTGPN